MGYTSILYLCCGKHPCKLHLLTTTSPNPPLQLSHQQYPEHNPSAAQISLLTGSAAAALMYGYWKIGPKRRYKARMRDMRSLRCARWARCAGHDARAGRAALGTLRWACHAGLAQNEGWAGAQHPSDLFSRTTGKPLCCSMRRCRDLLIFHLDDLDDVSGCSCFLLPQ